MKMKKNNIYVIFSILGVVVVLWQLLSSGYVLTLDMVFGPHVNLTSNARDLLNTIPTWYLLSFITSILGGWIAQKILLITIVFLMFYFPLRYFKKIFNLEDTHGAEYLVSIFYVVNPFVYERFLAGQWNVLLGYVLLVPIIAYLIQFCRDWNKNNSLKLLASIIILGMVSTHILVMVLIVISISIICNLIFLKGNRAFLKKSLLLGLGVLILSSYWIVPAILAKTTPLTIMGPEHWEVFKTTGNGLFGALGNVLSLHGFWNERGIWAERFMFPNENGWIFITSLIALFSIIITGIYSGLKDKILRRKVILIICITLLAVIFSCGVGDGIFKNINMWMFENISFWKGFRDSEKWSAIVALSYALFIGLGARQILLWIKNIKCKKIIFTLLIAVPIIYTPMMLFGLYGQIKTVNYPESWKVVNNVLKQDKNCKALFLPWQQYYELKFNDYILTGNTSRNYFDCDIVAGKNMELGSINSQGGNDLEYDLIEKVVMDNKANPDEGVEFLKQKGIKYIIYTDDYVDLDSYKYPFIGSKNLKKVITSDGVYLYRLI